MVAHTKVRQAVSLLLSRALSLSLLIVPLCLISSSASNFNLDSWISHGMSKTHFFSPHSPAPSPHLARSHVLNFAREGSFDT